jgi:hypothetical protein
MPAEMTLATRTTIKSDHPQFGLWLPVTFDVLQAIGLVGNLALIVTLLSAKQLRRHATWINFCCVWVLSSIIYLLLAFAGMQSGPQPPFGLCLTQAVLAYGAPVMTVYAMLSCVVVLWSVIDHLTSRSEAARREDLWQKSLLFVPYAIALVMIITATVTGLQDRTAVQRAGSGIYCVIANGVPGKINAVLCASAAIATLGLEISIGIKCHKHKKLYRSQAQLPMGMLVRVMIFTVVGLLGIGVSLVFVTSVFTPLPNIFIGLMPVAAFLIFGSQQDIIDVWLCRRARRSSFQPITSRGSVSKGSEV